MADDDRATRVRRELFLRALFPNKPPPAVARQMVQIMRELELNAGDVIYQKGEEANRAYFVCRGEVELAVDGEEPWRFDAGSVVGVLDLNLQRPRSRTARALSDVLLLEVPSDEWLEIFEDNLEFATTVRRGQGAGLHALLQDLSPDGGFAPRPPLTPEEAIEAEVLEGTMVERLVALRACRHFETASVQSLVELARRAQVVRVRRGEAVVRPGGGGAWLYVVIAGLVDIERRLAPAVAATFGPGDLLLGAAAHGGALGDYAVTARSDALVMSMRSADIDDVSEDHFDLVRSLLRGGALDREHLLGVKLRRARALAEAAPSALTESRRAAS
jgi:CRP-like cAMP-binding protein